MTFINNCRICLIDGASYNIFEDIESKHSIYIKLFHSLNEKIENVEGYPENICESCNTALDTVYKFVTKYKASCKLLECGLSKIKEEVDTAYSEETLNNEDYEIEILKNEPLSDSDGLESLDDFVMPEPQIQKPVISLSEIKAKLKNLKEINIKKKPVRERTCKTSKVAASILEADFDWNGESLRPSKPKEAKEDKIKQRIRNRKIRLPVPKKETNKPIKAKKQAKKLCDICGVFKPPEKLSAHKRDLHFGIESKCPQCTHKFSSEHNLRRHLQRVHTGKQFVCETCGKGFSMKGLLATHIKVVHLKTVKRQRLSCDKCDRTFCNKKTLLVHDRSAHTGLRPAVCEECGASFYHKEYLREHQRLHTGEVPFKCPICDRGYAQRGNMRSHIKHNHRLADLSPELLKTLKPRLKSAVCEECGKIFVCQSYLREHQRLHTGETPYKCPVCGRGYAQKGNMRSHMKQPPAG